MSSVRGWWAASWKFPKEVMRFLLLDSLSCTAMEYDIFLNLTLFAMFFSLLWKHTPILTGATHCTKTLSSLKMNVEYDSLRGIVLKPVFQNTVRYDTEPDCFSCSVDWVDPKEHK